MVPLLDANAQNLALEAELTSAFLRVLKSGQFILGPEVSGFEEEIARLAGVKHAIGVSSGTDAILLALMAGEIRPGDEILCPAFTFFATAGCIARVGATPVFVDVDPFTFNIDVEDARRKLTSRTRGIIPVHLYGQCAEMSTVCRLAEEYDLLVIEDAAQALGATYNNRSAGSLGDFGAFSFYPTKNLGGLGDGGMLVCQDDELAAKCRTLRNHGAEKTYHHKLIGGNFRLDALQAAFLRAKLPEYDQYTALRRSHAQYYQTHLSRLESVSTGRESSASAPRMVLPSAGTGHGHIWNQYTLRVPDRRDAFREFLGNRGVQTNIYYPVPLHRQECFASLARQGECVVADLLATEVVSIPIYAELDPSQLAEVVNTVEAFFQQ